MVLYFKAKVNIPIVISTWDHVNSYRYIKNTEYVVNKEVFKNE